MKSKSIKVIKICKTCGAEFCTYPQYKLANCEKCRKLNRGKNINDWFERIKKTS